MDNREQQIIDATLNALFSVKKNTQHKRGGLSRILFISAIVVAMMTQNALGQVKVSTIQSVFIYSTVKYMEWPDNDSDDFIILILGETNLFDELTRVAKVKKAGNRNMVVRKVSNMNEVTNCNILFIASDKVNLLDKISSNPNETMLIVTESEGAIDRGSDLNFVQRGEKMTFQIGEKSLATKKIKVSTSFATLAQK